MATLVDIDRMSDLPLLSSRQLAEVDQWVEVTGWGGGGYGGGLRDCGVRGGC
ncbi:hypothetical protein GCM10010442_72640 [Kitasatospora kifunensis]